MKNQFSIGEISKLHNIPVKTLRYYDEIGLFKPMKVDEKSRYRYYSTEQFEHLNTINYLKELGIPLKEIKEQFEQRDIDYFLTVLKKQQENTLQKIKELQQINHRFENRIKELEQSRNLDKIGVPFMKQLEARRVLRLKEPIRSTPELELSLRKLENISKRTASIFIGGVGVTISIQNIQKREFSEYNSIFLIVEEEEVSNDLVAVLAKGTYVCMYCNERRIEASAYYDRLFDFIQENGYTIIGDAIERTIIDDYISKNKEEFLSEIQIPVKPIE
ncbi:effector-binding domain-containing protein [Bacillus fengqiuensis]|nr:effector-binding domain-containing protein [Bacillus fengqiuensis]